MESKGPPLRIENLEAYLDEGLEHETQVVELLVVAQARGQNNPELWDKLHSAAMRDDRLIELAAVYEKLGQDRRVKIMPAPNQAQILLNTTKFFTGALGDVDAAERALERVLQLVPGHPDGFEQLRKILEERGDRARMIALHIASAGPKTEKEVSLHHLRAAMALTEEMGDVAESARVAGLVLKVDPSNEAALSAIAASLESQGKFQELARALEQLIAAEPPASDQRKREARVRLIELYDDKLPDVEKALPHVEEVLAADVAHAGARRVATRLLGIKAAAARAAHALELVYESEGDHAGTTQMLSIQIEQLRGPKKAEAQKKLGGLYWDIGDDASAHAQLEAVMGVDQSDDEVRTRYVELARRLGKQSDASRVLTRAAAAVKDPSLRGRINLESARLLSESGDPKRARLVLQTVLDQAESDVALEAARVMRGISPDAKSLAAVLEAITRLSPEPEEKLEVLGELATLYEGDLKDMSSAIQVRTRILGIDPTRESGDLERLLEARGEFDRLVEVLKARSLGMEDPDARRDILLRAARLLIDPLENHPDARSVLADVVEKHGPSRDAHALLLPLLAEPSFAAQRAEVLTAELALADEVERASISAALGAALLAQGKTVLALAAFAEVLSREPSETVARRELFELAQTGERDHKLAAARVLLPIFREEGAVELADLLRAVATESPEASERLVALEELYHVVPSTDAVVRLRLAAKGLGEVLAFDATGTPAWAARVAAQTGAPPLAVAMALAAPLEGRELAPREVVELAEQAAEALAASNKVDRAIALYRRVLETKPDDEATLHRVDELLQQGGTGEERVALFRSVLARPGSAERNRDLYLSIATVELDQLQSADQAIATLRAGLEELPRDEMLLSALLDALESSGRFAELAEELEKERAFVTSPREGAELELRVAELTRRADDLEGAVRHFKSALNVAELKLDGKALDPIEELAQSTVDVGLLIAVGERRVAIAGSEAERVAALAKLGGLFGDRGGDPVRAGDTLMEAAALARTAGLDDEAAQIFERVLAFQPDTKAALDALVELHTRSGNAAKLLTFTRRLVDLAETRAEALAAIEGLRGSAIEPPEVLLLLDKVDARLGASAEVGLLRADVLVHSGREADAAALLLELAKSEDELIAGEAQALLGELFSNESLTPGLLLAKRQWLEHRVETADDSTKRACILDLLALARDEEKDEERAGALADRLLDLDPTDDEALVVRFELARNAGAWEKAAETLSRRVEIANDDETRAQRSLELAEFLCARTEGIVRALDVLWPLFSTHGDHPVFRRVAAAALSEADASDRAAEMLATLAASQTDRAARAATYDHLFTHAPRSALREREAELFVAWLDCLDDTDSGALVVAARAARTLPDREIFWDRAEELARLQKSPGGIAEAYRSTLSTEGLSEEIALAVGERGVAFQEEWFDDQEAVVEMLRLVVKVAPSAMWAFERLKLIYNAGERWPELFDLYDDVIRGQSDEEAKLLVLEDAAEVAKDLVGDAERAIHYLEQLRSFRKEDAKVALTLERLYERHQKTRPLIELLTSRLGLLSAEKAAAQRLRIVGLHESVGDRESALGVLGPLLETSDASAIAIASRWMTETEPADDDVPRYERLARARPDQSTLRRRANAILGPVFKALGERTRFVRSLEISLESSLDADDRLPLLRELQNAAAEDDNADLSLDAALGELLLTDDERAATLCIDTALISVAGRDDKTRLLASAILTIANKTEARARALFLLEQGAKLAREELSDEGLGVSFELAILARSDGDPEAAIAAAKKLDQNLAAMGREAERCAVLEQLGRLSTDPTDKRSSLLEAARIARDVSSNRPRAVVNLRLWLAEDPGDIDVLTQLIELVRDLGQSRELADALTQRAEITTDKEQRAGDRVELATVLADEVGDKPRAIDAFKAAIEQRPDSAELRDRLYDLLCEEARFDEFVARALDEVDRDAADKSRSARAVQLLSSAAEVERKRGHLDQALRVYDRALKLEPTNVASQTGLETLVGALTPADPAFAKGVTVLAKSFETAGQVDRWLGLVPARLLCMTNDLEKCEILLAAAKLEEEDQKSDLRALERTLSAFAIRAEFPTAAELLLDRAKRTERWDLLSPHLLPGLRPTTEDGVSAIRRDIARSIVTELLVRTATYWEVRPDHAAEKSSEIELLLAAAHEADPVDAAILHKLVAHRRHAPSAALVEALEKLASLLPGGESEELELLEEAATVAMRDAGDEDAAVRIARSLREKASARIATTADGAIEDKVLWALEIEVARLRKTEERALERAVYLETAELAIAAGSTRALLLRAADLADTEERTSILERVYAADPSDTVTFEHLSALYEELGRKADLARLKLRMAEATAAGGDRADLRLAAARIQEELGQREGAVSSLRATLSEAPTHEPTVTLLIELLESKDAELTSVLESSGEVFAQRNPSLALAYFDRAAKLAETKLKDSNRAIRSVQKRIEIDPSGADLDRLAVLFQSTGQPRDEATALERLIETAGASDELSLRLATAYGKAGFVERAREQLEKAVSEGRGSTRVRDVLAEIYRSAGAHEPLATLLETEAGDAADASTKVEKLRAAAALRLHELHEPAAAAALLERAIEVKPDDLQTLFALADVRRVEGDMPRARDVLTRILGEFGTRKPKERALVHYELAKLCVASGDRTQALAELDSASKIDPAHAGVLSLLGEISILEGQYLRANRTYRGLLLVLRSQKGDKKEESKARVMVELAYVSDHQREPERKTEFIENALAAAREDTQEYEPLLAALDKRGYGDVYAKALEEYLEKGDIAEDRRLSLRIEKALLLGRKLGRPDDAVAECLACLDSLLPEGRDGGTTLRGGESALASILALLAELSRMGDLLAHYTAAARDAHGTARVRFLGRALLVAERDLKDDDKTAEMLEALLSAWDDASEGTGEEKREALTKLDRLLAPHNHTEAGGLRHARVLASFIELSTIETAPFSNFAPALYRLAQLYAKRAELDEAHEVLDRARTEDPDGDRFEGELRALLDEHKGDIRFVRLLEDFGRDRGRRQATIDALLILAATSADEATILREAYELSTELEDNPQSERLLRRLVKPTAEEDTADDVWALSALADLRFGSSDAREAATLWERAAKVSEPADERAILVRVADLVDRVLGDPDRAIAIMSDLQKRDPADRELWQPLAELYRRKNSVEEFAELMNETIPLVEDVGERNALRVNLGTMLKDVDPERAATILGEAIDEQPSNAPAAELLEVLYAALGRDDQLAVLLERQLDGAKDTDDKSRVIALSLRIGGLRERLGDGDAALDAYHGALDWDENNLEALRSAVRLHTEREDSIVLGDLLDRLLMMETGDEAVNLALKVADMKLASGDAVGAERALSAGFKANGRSTELKQRLTNLYNERNDRVGLARLSAGEARYITDPRSKKDLLLAAAETIKAEGDARESVELYSEALDADPDDRDTLFSFMDVCATTAQHQRAIAAVDRALTADEKDAWLLFSRAVLREATGESDAALDDLDAAFEHSGGQYAAELRAHIEAALTRVAHDPTASRRTERELRLKLAEVQAATGDAGAARVIIDGELARNPHDPDLLRAMGRVEEGAGRDDAAATAYARACAVAQGPLLSRTALLLVECARRLGRPGLARAGLERAIGADPNAADLRLALRSVYEETGAMAELADLIVAEAHAQAEPVARFERLLEAARLLLYSHGDEAAVTTASAERATRILEEAKEIRADSQDAQQLLAEALASLGRMEEARELAAAVISSHRSKRSRELGQAYYALYRIETKGGNLSEALEALSKAFDNQPQNGSLALELGQLAIDLDHQEIAQRAFRAVTLLKPDALVSTRDRATAYFHLGSIAVKAGDARRGKLMLEKALAEEPTLDEARELLARLAV